MSDDQKGPIGRFLALPADSVPKTIFVAVAVCLVASMIVSAAAVALRPAQQINALKDKATSEALEDDPAGIGRQATHVTVYLLRDEAGAVDKVILPIHGYGLWSTLYGFIALEENGNDIFGLQFYEHAETPGLGAEVDNPRWRALWSGAKLRDDSGDLQITVAKTAPAAGDEFHIDALAGATLTSVGVDNLIKFWMGERGYAPFLENLKAGGV